MNSADVRRAYGGLACARMTKGADYVSASGSSESRHFDQTLLIRTLELVRFFCMRRLETGFSFVQKSKKALSLLEDLPIYITGEL